MKSEELKAKIKDGEVEIIATSKEEDSKESNLLSSKSKEVSDTGKDKTIPESLDDYIIILEAIRTTKKTLTAAPTFIPKNFSEQIQFVKIAGTPDAFYVYFYLNGTGWKKITLT